MGINSSTTNGPEDSTSGDYKSAHMSNSFQTSNRQPKDNYTGSKERLKKLHGSYHLDGGYVKTEQHSIDGVQDKPQPWRRFERDGDWNEKYAEKLLTDIKSIRVKDTTIDNINILLTGPVKAGKSSFMNSVATIDKGRISQITAAGGQGKSMTKKLKYFQPNNKLKNLNIFDTMGVEENDSHGIHINDVLFVVQGNIRPNYMFTPDSPIKEGVEEFNENPPNTDKMHCVVYIMDANVVGQDNIPEASKRKMRDIQDTLDLHDIPSIVLLTKIDVLDEAVEKDITKTFESADVKRAVDLTKELFHVPEQNIFPVQNYSMEMEPDFRKEILILLALKQMVLFGLDYLDIQFENSNNYQNNDLE